MTGDGDGLRAGDGYVGHSTRSQVIDPTPVRVAGRFTVPRRFRAEVDDLELPCVVTLTVTVDDDGHAACEEVALRARPGGVVRAAMLRDVPLKQLTRLAAASVRESDGPDGREAHVDFVGSFDRPVPPRRRPTHDDAYFREVAAVCAAAEEAGGSAVDAVMERFFLAQSTAYRHIARAREFAR